MLNQLLRDLDLNDTEARVYFHLLRHGGCTAGILAKKMGLVRPTLYNLLQAMSDKGVLVRTLKKGVRMFHAETPDNLEILFEKKICQLQKNKERFHAVLPQLKKMQGSSLLKPHMQLFEGKEGLQHIYNDVLLYHDIDTCTFWPAKSMIQVLPKDFLAYHTEQRLLRNIRIRGIWPPSEAVDVRKYVYMSSGDAWLRYVRSAPEDVRFTMGIWIYADKVAFLSSIKESFGMLIESAELARVQQAQWNLLWKISRPLEMQS